MTNLPTPLFTGRHAFSSRAGARRGLSLLVLIISIVVAMAGPSVAEPDTSPPVLSGISLASGGPFGAGESVTMQWAVTDDVGVKYVGVALRDAAGKSHYITGYNAVTSASTTIDSSWANGPVTVESIQVIDTADNQAYYTPGGQVSYYPSGSGTHAIDFSALTFVAENTGADTSPPVLSGISLASGGPFGAGESVTMQWAVTDDVGVKYVGVALRDAAGKSHYITGYNAVTSASTTIDSSWANGPVTVESIQVIDTADNQAYYTPGGQVSYYPSGSGTHAIDFSALTFVAENTGADTSPPVLSGISLASGGPFGAGESVTMQWAVTDDVGVKYVGVALRDAAGKSHYITGYNAVTSASTTIDSSWANGPVTVESIQVIDTADNQAYYTPGGQVSYYPSGSGTHAIDFSALTFRIGAEPIDTAPPVLSEFDFTPQAVDVASGAKTVTVTARVTDATGTEAPVMLIGSDTTTQSAGFGTMTLVSGSAKDGVWSRVVTIPATAAPGSWTVKIYPLDDTLGNGESEFHHHPTKLTVANGQADVAPPVLSEFDFTPQAVDVASGAKTVTVTARVTDATGTEAPVMLIGSDTTTQSAGFGTMTLVSGSAKDGVWSRVVTIPATAAPGSWTVKIYPLDDTLGNGESEFHHHPTKLTVANGQADVAPPVLSEFDFTPQAVDVASGAKTVTVTARVTDATGTEAPVMLIGSDTTTQSAGFGTMTLVSGSAKDGVWSRVVTIPATAAPGSWTVKIYPLDDTLGNGESEFHHHPTKLTVANGQADVAPPVLSEFDFTPQAVDVASGAKTVTVTARVTDATGTEAPVMLIGSDTTTQSAGFGTMTLVSGSAKDGVWSRVVTIPATAAPGSWTVKIYPLDDTLGNGESEFHHHPTKLTVANGQADVAPPVLSEFDFTPQAVDVASGAKTVTVTARVTDATGTEAPVMLIGSDTTTQSAGFGTMTLVSGSAKDGVWSRVVTIPATAAPGSWTVKIYPLDDTLGNGESEFHHHPTKLTVANGQADVAPPVLSEFDFTPQAVDVASGAKTVTVTARVTDATGTEAPVMLIGSDTTTQSAGFGTMTLVSGSAKDGVWSRVVTIPATAAPGSWTVKIYPLDDTLGNGESEFHHHPTKLTVANGPEAPVATAPDAPTQVRASRGNASAVVSWSAPADNGSPITSYTVTSSPGGRSIEVSGDTTRAVITGLNNGTPYTFTVTATNAAAPSPASAPSTAVTPASRPGRVAKPTVKVDGRTAVIRWSAARAGGSPLTGYRLTLNGKTRTVGPSVSKLALKRLKPGRYKVKVAAINAVGVGSASYIATFRVRTG